MSYDFYAYRRQSPTPDQSEAELLVGAFNEAEEAALSRDEERGERDEIVTALLNHNPRLTIFEPDFCAIAALDETSEAEARRRYQHAELNPAEGDPAIQLTVHRDHVFISIPYWYGDKDVDRVFAQLSDYLKVMRKTAGYFGFDPQTGVAFDPLQLDVLDHAEYDRVMEAVPGIIARTGKTSKPWWRFW
jgi:hypothetical protein